MSSLVLFWHTDPSLFDFCRCEEFVSGRVFATVIHHIYRDLYIIYLYVRTYLYIYIHIHVFICTQKICAQMYNIYLHVYTHISKASMFERQKHVEPHTARPSLRISLSHSTAGSTCGEVRLGRPSLLPVPQHVHPAEGATLTHTQLGGKASQLLGWKHKKEHFGLKRQPGLAI